MRRKLPLYDSSSDSLKTSLSSDAVQLKTSICERKLKSLKDLLPFEKLLKSQHLNSTFNLEFNLERQEQFLDE